MTYCGHSSMSDMYYIYNSNYISICTKQSKLIRNYNELFTTFLLSTSTSLLPLSSTGRCKNFPSCMLCSASIIGVSTVAHSGFGVMTCKSDHEHQQSIYLINYTNKIEVSYAVTDIPTKMIYKKFFFFVLRDSGPKAPNIFPQMKSKIPSLLKWTLNEDFLLLPASRYPLN